MSIHSSFQLPIYTPALPLSSTCISVCYCCCCLNILRPTSTAICTCTFELCILITSILLAKENTGSVVHWFTGNSLITSASHPSLRCSPSGVSTQVLQGMERLSSCGSKFSGALSTRIITLAVLL